MKEEKRKRKRKRGEYRLVAFMEERPQYRDPERDIVKVGLVAGRQQLLRFFRLCVQTNEQS
jgi:hypothetical protein